MPRTRPFKELRDKLSPESQKKANEKTLSMLAKMPLQELRKALSLTQTQVAETLNMSQTAVSKIENQTDMYVSTLRRFVEAMGGKLKITASFPLGEIEISQFSVEQSKDEQEAA